MAPRPETEVWPSAKFYADRGFTVQHAGPGVYYYGMTVNGCEICVSCDDDQNLPGKPQGTGIAIYDKGESVTTLSMNVQDGADIKPETALAALVTAAILIAQRTD